MGPGYRHADLSDHITSSRLTATCASQSVKELPSGPALFAPCTMQNLAPVLCRFTQRTVRPRPVPRLSGGLAGTEEAAAVLQTETAASADDLQFNTAGGDSGGAEAWRRRL